MFALFVPCAVFTGLAIIVSMHCIAPLHRIFGHVPANITLHCIYIFIPVYYCALFIIVYTLFITIYLYIYIYGSGRFYVCLCACRELRNRYNVQRKDVWAPGQGPSSEDEDEDEDEDGMGGFSPD